MSKVLVIMSSDDVNKAAAGFAWATNALKNKWVDDVEIVLFGPIEKKISEGNEILISWIEKLRQMQKLPYACKAIAQEKNFEASLKLYAKVEYVGEMIARFINNGYVPMVF